MHGLKMPLHLPGGGVQTHERLGEEVGAGTLPAVVVAGRRGRREVQQAASLVERHRGPDVGVAIDAPRPVLPRRGSRILLGLRNRRERPHAATGAGVERLHPPQRIGQLHAVGHLAANDDQVSIDDRRRALGDVREVAHPRQALVEWHRAAVAERGDRLAGGGIQHEQAMPAVEEQAQPAAVVAPHGRAAQFPAAARQHLAQFVGGAIEAPELATGLGVERGNAVVRSRDVEDAVDHQRRGLELAGSGAVVREPGFPVLPLPRRLQPRHVAGVDVGERRVPLPALVAAEIRPLDLARRGLRQDQDAGADECETKRASLVTAPDRRA